MSPRFSRAGVAIVLSAAIGFSIAGCAPAAEVATPSLSASAKPESPTPTPTPTPSGAAPVETPAPVAAITCDTVLVEAEYAQLETDGLTFRGADTSGSEALQLMGDTDGISCKWVAPNTDNIVSYAQWPSDPTTWEALRSQVVANGAAETGEAAFELPGADTPAALVYRDGVVYYASPARILNSASALQ